MMNKVQKKYMIAKETLQTYEKMEADIEKKYIIENGIKNEDGKIPARVYYIDDDNTFDKANEETAMIVQESGLEEKINSAKENLIIAEENMIKFALSIVPAGIRKTLEKGVKKNYTIRMKLIDYTFRLDVSTI
ncbi:MAG: hypothetical protein K2N80_17190 [Lachnospiraceae bacterium]|nr:hypothetical protein [Lachnospiraceae bacterium]